MIPRKRLNHDTLHWVNADSDYFITICADPKGRNHFCHPELGTAILYSVRIYHEL